MKYSRQRELILETVQRSDDHPTADTIYTRVRAQDPKVSLGTVYRNLNLLCENGQLLKVPIPGASDRFDHTLGDHAHAYCEACGSVTDVLPQALPHAAGGPEGRLRLPGASDELGAGGCLPRMPKENAVNPPSKKSPQWEDFFFCLAADHFSAVLAPSALTAAVKSDFFT